MIEHVRISYLESIPAKFKKYSKTVSCVIARINPCRKTVLHRQRYTPPAFKPQVKTKKHKENLSVEVNFFRLIQSGLSFYEKIIRGRR